MNLKGVAILEKDHSDDIILAWNFPIFDGEEYTHILISHSFINDFVNDSPSRSSVYTYTKYKEKWIYILSSYCNPGASILAFAICLFSTEYQPEKYAALCQSLSEIYIQSFNPHEILFCYLDVFSLGNFKLSEKSFDSNDFNNNDHLLLSSIKEIILLFEDSTLWLWSALIMKKRIALYSDNYQKLQKHIRALPLFVSHRRDWNLLRPYVNLSNEDEIKDLNEVIIYVAGFTDINIKQRTEHFDILFDLSTGTFIIPEKSKDDFVETSYHNQVTKIIQECLENEQKNDKDVIKDIRECNKVVIDNLKKLAKEGHISYETIQEQESYSPPLKAFLYAVASAEGMTN